MHALEHQPDGAHQSLCYHDTKGGNDVQQFCATTAMGKRLIGKAMAQHPDIKTVLEKGTLAIIAGTTNGYVAEEILKSLDQAEGFSRLGFRRGITVAPGAETPQIEFPGDVVITNGQWQKGKTVLDVADDLKTGDIVLKGANAVDPRGQPAVQIGHPQGGTILAALPAIIGRRVRLIVPVGLEKRVLEDVDLLAQRCNAPEAHGPRLCPMPGEIFTEIDAIRLLTGAEACLIAGGGIYGAEGAYWFGISGTEEQVDAAAELIKSVRGEPPCQV
jgi:hypothetical protein